MFCQTLLGDTSGTRRHVMFIVRQSEFKVTLVQEKFDAKLTLILFA